MSIVLNDTTARASFTAAAAQTVFALSFKFFATTDLLVAKNGVQLTLTTDYTVQGANADAGMGITLVSGAALNDVITVIRVLPIERTTDFQLTGPFPVASLNTALSKLTAMIQQVRDSVGRSPTLGTYDVDGLGSYSANSNKIGSLAAGVAATDAINKGQLDTALIAAGNVVAPGASFARKVLTALSATTWSWALPSVLLAELSDASANGRSLMAATYAGMKTLLGLTDANKRTVVFIIDGGGGVISTGVKGYLQIPFGATITRWSLWADVSGSIVVDVWKAAQASYPPTIGGVITASAKPTISAATNAQSSTLTGWTTAITANDVLGFNVNSVATVTRVTVELELTVS